MSMGHKSPPIVEGYWEDSKTNWQEQRMVYCDECGMLIPKRQFIVEADYVCHRFCGPDCATLSQQSKALSLNG